MSFLKTIRRNLADKAGNIALTANEMANLKGQIDAIGRSQAVIEFEMDGTIITANDNFLSATGYALEEIQGEHHRLFAEPHYAESDAYAAFWANLNQGNYDTGEYKRLAKGGREIWIQASYNPILDENGKPFKVVKYASDITAQKRQSADFEGQIDAINKSQAVIEFEMDGTITHANDNFLATVGYSLDEIHGRHHRMFAEPDYASSNEYKEFWANLNRGKYDAGEYKRIGKDGREIWIQASYNPILDPDGRPIKVVKYATDITQQKLLQEKVEKTLEETAHVMRGLAKGDLNRRITADFEEFADLKSAVNESLDNLRDTVVEIREVAESVDVGSNQIAKGNSHLSDRTEQQASKLAETASSMEQMTGTVRQNADSSSKANRLAIEARDEAENGGEVVSRAVQAMIEISESSGQIAEIIGVIDEIAFQTNLLALNASVEAARAGEQGRGFAVVASEVRNLAGRSAVAAKEIKNLIEDSGAKVEEGSRLVNQSGETLEQIVAGIKKVTSIMADISAASEEQAAGVSQVGASVTELDDLTQQNAALVEEASAASDSLSDQATRLGQLMAAFEVGSKTVCLADNTKEHSATEADRRAAGRPWSSPAPNSSVPAASPASSNKVAAAGSDADWSEF